MKFGGTSVGSAQNIAHVASIIAAHREQRPVVVVSALSKVTDMLIELADKSVKGRSSAILKKINKRHVEVLSCLGLPSSVCDDLLNDLKVLVTLTQKRQKLDRKTLDHFQTFGERLCARITASQLVKNGTPAKAFDAWELGMITTNRFGDAEPLPSAYATLRKKIEALRVVPVVTGFIGKTKDGFPTTLGRGGSDFAAAIIGAAIGAGKIQIWKEVDGILTTDPRVVPEARIIRELAYEEASELAYFGAKVLHPKTILPAMRRNIPVQVLNTFKPNEPGTTIVSGESYAGKRESIEAFTSKKNVIAIHISSPDFFDGSGLMARIYDVFKKYRTSIDIVSTSVVSVSVTIDDDEHLSQIVKELTLIGSVTVERDKAIVCAVGGGVNTAGVAGRMFNVLGREGIDVEMISQAAGGISVTFVVKNKEADRAVRTLHTEFITA